MDRHFGRPLSGGRGERRRQLYLCERLLSSMQFVASNIHFWPLGDYQDRAISEERLVAGCGRPQALRYRIYRSISSVTVRDRRRNAMGICRQLPRRLSERRIAGRIPYTFHQKKAANPKRRI